MKNPNYTYRELVHHLDLYTTDPLVRRLIDMLVAGENSIVTNLVEEGMDPVNYTFTYDSQDMDVGEYIRQLKRDCQLYEDEMWLAQRELEDEQGRRRQLETRSVAELLASMEELVKRANSERDNANRIIRKVEQENDELKEKINVWKVIES